MEGLFRLAVNVGIAEQALVHAGALPDVETDDDHVHVGLAARVRAPGEGAVRKGDLQPSAVEQERPELRHLLALGDGVGGPEDGLVSVPSYPPRPRFRCGQGLSK